MILQRFINHFMVVSDPREDNARHKLIDIIVITFCAAVAGADTWEDVKLFGEAKENWFRGFLELPHGIPSQTTFARVLASINPEEFNTAFLSWVRDIHSHIPEDVINVDGKTVRHSFDSTSSKSAIHMVSAWSSTAGLTLGQRKVNEKSNEITAIPELLKTLEITGCTVTIDAMGTQKAIAEHIREQGGDYLLALKGNQETLREDIELFFNDAVEHDFSEEIGRFDYYATVDKDHGRVEKREYWVTSDIDWLSMKGDWRDLTSICMVRSTREIKGRTTVEHRYYISSLKPNAENIGITTRKHWGIENSLHWVLDIVFREDECRKRKDHSAENFAIIRHIALNTLKKDVSKKRVSIRGKRKKAGWDNRYLEKILRNVC
jgi:predicted transposase YbfD/YdcC